MYLHVKSRTNESAYLKRLIQRDMEGGYQHTNIPKRDTSKDKQLLKELIL
jgi:hypothetical protein